MQDYYDIIVGGGGLIGSIMALSLAEYGFKVAKIDKLAATKQRSWDFDGRAYTLSLSTVKMLLTLKLWKEISPRAEPVLDMKITDGISGYGVSPLHMHFDHREMIEGPLAYVIEDRFLRQAVLKRTKRFNTIKEFSGNGIIAQQSFSGHCEVKLSNGDRIKTKLLIGADGRNSEVAAGAGLKRTTYSYEQISLVCAVSHDKNHEGQAHQFFMPAGPLAILPLPGKISSVVWTVDKGLGERLGDTKDQLFVNELKRCFGDFRGDIQLKGKRYAYPLSLSFVPEMVSNRIALVGDAAHAIHPIAGQGLNLGMRDVASLAEVILSAHRIGEDIGSEAVLQRYNQWRTIDRISLGGLTHFVNKLFSNDNFFLRSFRDIGLAVINRNTGLKTRLIEEASGLLGDTPALMRGKGF